MVKLLRHRGAAIIVEDSVQRRFAFVTERFCHLRIRQALFF